MATHPISQGSETEPPHYCESCGAPVSGPFCPHCGHSTGIEEEPAGAEAPTAPHAVAPREPHPVEPVPPPAAPSPSGRRRGVLIAAVIAVAVLVAGGVAAALVLTSGGEDSGKTYRQELATAFGPVLGANEQLSAELGRLRGTKVPEAKAAVRRAQQATTEARGAVGALSVPQGSEGLARDAREVLDHEGAYLAAVAAVLARPSRTAAAQVPALAASLESALTAAGPTVAGTTDTVSNAENLVAWAPRAASAIRAQEDEAQPPSGTSTPSEQAPSTSGSTGGGPLANGRACGDGVYAGPNTSCEFAFNVREAYYQAPGLVATVRVYSPATGLTYTMDCAPSGDGVTCSGGNNASVGFD